MRNAGKMPHAMQTAQGETTGAMRIRMRRPPVESNECIGRRLRQNLTDEARIKIYGDAHTPQELQSAALGMRSVGPYVNGTSSAPPGTC